MYKIKKKISILQKHDIAEPVAYQYGDEVFSLSYDSEKLEIDSNGAISLKEDTVITGFLGETGDNGDKGPSGSPAQLNIDPVPLIKNYSVSNSYEGSLLYLPDEDTIKAGVIVRKTGLSNKQRELFELIGILSWGPERYIQYTHNDRHLELIEEIDLIKNKLRNMPDLNLELMAHGSVAIQLMIKEFGPLILNNIDVAIDILKESIVARIYSNISLTNADDKMIVFAKDLIKRLCGDAWTSDYNASSRYEDIRWFRISGVNPETNKPFFNNGMGFDLTHEEYNDGLIVIPRGRLLEIYKNIKDAGQGSLYISSPKEVGYPDSILLHEDQESIVVFERDGKYHVESEKNDLVLSVDDFDTFGLKCNFSGFPDFMVRVESMDKYGEFHSSYTTGHSQSVMLPMNYKGDFFISVTTMPSKNKVYVSMHDAETKDVIQWGSLYLVGRQIKISIYPEISLG